MNEQDIKELLAKYHAGNCTEEEKSVLESWYLQIDGEDFDLSEKELELIKRKSWQNIVRSRKHRIITPRTSWMPYAAAVFIFSALAIYFFVSSPKKSDNHVAAIEQGVQKDDLAPGGNKAVLTLSDGTAVSLDDSADGLVVQIEGMEIMKTSDGQIIYKITNNQPLSDESSHRYNQVSTPRGGQFQIILPDGTKVWLNAASSIKYPVQFNNSIRRVELLGEAYFEVHKQETLLGDRVPFIVATATQHVEVLGTQFNINSYEDEDAVKTTLLEGSVRVSPNSSSALGNGVVLKPNQQSIVNGADLNVIKVSADESVAWKNGYFKFDHANIETVMRQLSRWYDVDVVFDGDIPQGTFTGKVYRNMKISEVLEILAFAKINFKIEGKKMTIFS